MIRVSSLGKRFRQFMLVAVLAFMVLGSQAYKPFHDVTWNVIHGVTYMITGHTTVKPPSVNLNKGK